MKKIIDCGGDVNCKDKEKNTALMIASCNGYVEGIELLLKNGAQIEDKNDEGKTALLIAVEHGEQEAVKMLLDNKADINTVDNRGDSPLICAVEAENEEMVEMLLDKGADVKIKNYANKTALKLADNENIKKMIFDEMKKKNIKNANIWDRIMGR